MLGAVIFDFDGVIVDTETPLFTAWQRVYEHFGVEPIALAEWADSLGRHDDDPELLDPLARLQAAYDCPLDVEHVQDIRRALRDHAVDQLPTQPGVVALLDSADALGLPVAIASSSPPDWIERHLGQRGLLERFPIVSCAGDGVPGKPDPAVYLRAADALHVDARTCLAFEDSPHGTTAAKRAGMACVAVPTTLGASLDFSHADRVVATLDDVTLPDWHPSDAPSASRS